MAAIVKPAGILVSGNKFKTIAHSLPYFLTKSEAMDSCTPQPVHRLDFGTSGILLCAKTQSSIRLLNQMFEYKQISKCYFAITAGRMPEFGTISLEVDQKPSTTHFKCVQTVESMKYQALNLLKLEPVSGRRHQIRKHLSGIGHPILGDQQYGKDHLSSQVKGLHLHSFSLEFTHPITKKELHIEAPLPKRFRRFFNDV